jgi:hypothetical protein
MFGMITPMESMLFSKWYKLPSCFPFCVYVFVNFSVLFIIGFGLLSEHISKYSTKLNHVTGKFAWSEELIQYVMILIIYILSIGESHCDITQC